MADSRAGPEFINRAPSAIMAKSAPAKHSSLVYQKHRPMNTPFADFPCFFCKFARQLGQRSVSQSNPAFLYRIRSGHLGARWGIFPGQRKDDSIRQAQATEAGRWVCTGPVILADGPDALPGTPQGPLQIIQEPTRTKERIKGLSFTRLFPGIKNPPLSWHPRKGRRFNAAKSFLLRRASYRFG